MSAKAIDNEKNLQHRFFLLMVAPLLIGLMISLTNFAHAEWNNESDPLPTKQGWKQVKTRLIPNPIFN